jgi:hypothetical protein
MGKYNLERLGWFNFERIITTLLKEVVGPGVSSFSGSSDQGRDATYTGRSNFPSADSPSSGHWIFQVKYRSVEQRDIVQIRNELRSSLSEELIKILQKYHHQCDVYLYLTNCPLTAKNKDELQTIITEVGIKKGYILGNQDIEELLDLNPKIVRAFPQIMGLGQLREITHWGLNQRSIQYLNQAQEDLDTFVVTEPYMDALDLLRKQHFCILTGAPKMGKTCTADALAAAFAADGFSIYDLRTQKDYYDFFVEEEKQLFVCDDVFGDIALQDDKRDEWTQSINRLLRTLNSKHKLIWTARSYILKEAIESSKLEEDRKELKQDIITVNVESLSELEKAMILYNHAKKAHLPDNIKDIIKSECESIVKSRYFAPETIRQLCMGGMLEFTQETQDKAVIVKKINDFLQSPGLAWKKAFKNAPPEVNFLCIQLMSNGGIIFYEHLKNIYEHEIQSKGLEWPLFENAFKWSEGTFIRRRQLWDKVEVQFYHPSMRDLLIELIQEEPSTRQSYISRLSIREFAGLITTTESTIDESSEHKLKIAFEDRGLLEKYFKEDVLPNLDLYDTNILLTVLSTFIAKNSFDKLPDIGKLTLEEITKAFCEETFWEFNYNNRLHRRADEWRKSIEEVEYIIEKTSINNIPKYLDKILTSFYDEKDIEFWKIAKTCESLSEAVTLKFVDFEKRNELRIKLEGDVQNAISECPDDGSSNIYRSEYDGSDGIDYEQCETWHAQYDNLVDECDSYLLVFEEDEIEDLDELRNLKDNCPQGGYEPDYDRDDFSSPNISLLNIREIFKDL